MYIIRSRNKRSILSFWIMVILLTVTLVGSTNTNGIPEDETELSMQDEGWNGIPEDEMESFMQDEQWDGTPEDEMESSMQDEGWNTTDPHDMEIYEWYEDDFGEKLAVVAAPEVFAEEEEGTGGLRRNLGRSYGNIRMRYVPLSWQPCQSRGTCGCFDQSYRNNNVYIHDCNGGRNQKWRYNSRTKEIYNLSNGNCLDAHLGNGNVYGRSCHGGRNQKWYRSGGRIRNYETRQCIDVSLALHNYGNLIMYGCHSHWNQKFGGSYSGFWS